MAVRGLGGVGCPNHRGRAGPGHMFIVRGGFWSPMIRSQSVPLPSLVRILPKNAVHMKKATLDGTFEFHTSPWKIGVS